MRDQSKVINSMLLQWCMAEQLLACPWNTNSSVFIVHKCQAYQKAGFLKEAIQNLILALKTTSF